jgi:uncharacterized protein YdeI (YjbR/CyaY-like superfamily)
LSAGTRDPRIDAYIANAEEFARPVLAHLREVVHEACPETVESMKWSVPHFTYRGILCSMAAFRQHCAFGFWKGSLILPRAGGPAGEAMGQFGRITSIADLPPREVLIGYVREAVKLNESGVRVPRAAAPERDPTPPLPEALRTALEQNPAAAAAFERFSPSQRREYAAWIAEAKRDATRELRTRTALKWIAEGKPRNWKYMKRGS